MKAKWIGESDFPFVTNGKIYEVVKYYRVGKRQDLWYEIINDMDDISCYRDVGFEVVEETFKGK